MRKYLLISLLAVTTVYAAWMTYSASRLRAELAGLKAPRRQIHARHSVQFAGKLTDKAFREVLKALEAENGADIIMASDSTTAVNKAPDIQIK